MNRITYTKEDIIRKVSNNLNVPKDEIKIIFSQKIGCINVW